MRENHNNQIDYLPVAEWRRAVREALIRNEVERRTAEKHLTTLEDEYICLKDEEGLITQAMRAYAAHLEAPSERIRLSGNSLREILIIHFADSSGIITGREVSIALLDIGYFTDRRAADGAIYTILSKPPFVKIDKGIYLVPMDSPEWRSLRQGNGQRPNGNGKEDIRSSRSAHYLTDSVQPSKSMRQEQIEAIVSYAKLRKGYIRSHQAKVLLKQAKLMTNTKTVGLAAHSVLTKSGKFDKVERGLYRLLE